MGGFSGIPKLPVRPATGGRAAASSGTHPAVAPTGEETGREDPEGLGGRVEAAAPFKGVDMVKAGAELRHVATFGPGRFARDAAGDARVQGVTVPAPLADLWEQALKTRDLPEQDAFRKQLDRHDSVLTPPQKDYLLDVNDNRFDHIADEDFDSRITRKGLSTLGQPPALPTPRPPRNPSARPDAEARIASRDAFTEREILDREPSDLAAAARLIDRTGGAGRLTPATAKGRAGGTPPAPVPIPAETDTDEQDFTPADIPERDYDAVFRALNRDLKNEHLAIRQGTSPIVRQLDGTLNYQPAPPGERHFFAETGRVPDPGRYVALYDPATDRLELFSRNPKMEESGLLRLGRLLGLGLVTGPKGAAAAAKNVRAAGIAAANGRFARWAEGVLTGTHNAKGEIVRIGRLDKDVLAFLETKSIRPETATISMRDSDLRHLARDVKRQAGKAVPDALIRRLPEILDQPRAVLWDKTHGNLTYVFDVPGDPRKGKFVVNVNYNVKQSADRLRQTRRRNIIRTGGLIGRDNLLQKDVYELITGNI